MFNITSPKPTYDQNAVQPMRDELIAAGFEELLTPDEVEKVLKVNDDKTILVVINSVCGSAAGSARPGVSYALQNNLIPDKLYTVFAGQEKEAVDKVRSMITEYPPSSPCIALFKNGNLLYFMQRTDIKERPAKQIANELVEIFNEYCSAKGPSVSPENLNKIMYAKQCGSKIPLFKG
ncbi:MAG TPA: BrxA/BrxB family bacilliredoxin [Ignavibacteria bacterium]|nr:BrxA/BrxB family bacilliredoxin [Ignavibacteria bacterium]